MINLRKLAAMDMALHGVRIITAEFAIGIVLPLALGLLSLRSGPLGLDWQTVSGVWLIGIAANYLPLFFYAVAIARAGTAKAEGEPEFARARRYNVQQLLILVPFLIAVAALVQELSSRMIGS